MNLLLAEQQEFDAQHFDQRSWHVSEWRDQKTCHIGHHILKASYKLLEGSSPVEVKGQVIPDLSIYRSQLVTIHELPADMLDGKDDREANETGVLRTLFRASGELANYLEPAEHGAVNEDLRLHYVPLAVRHLHIAVRSLASMHGLDDAGVEAAHLQRMDELRQNGS